MRQTWEKATYSLKTGILSLSRFTFGKAVFAIMLVAVLHNLVFLPLKIKSAIQARNSVKKLKELQPAIKAINEKYRLEPGQRRLAKQASQQGQEIKRLYQEAGISFNLGCLSTIMPIFSRILLTSAVTEIKKDERFKEGGILWFKDLTRPDRYFVLPALQMGILFLRQRIVLPELIEPEKPHPVWLRRMKTFNNWSPLLGFLLILITRKRHRHHSGLTLFYITSSSLELTEDYFIKKLIKDAG
jgi:membrane protein insertase Oxa1/YidC/SpoIIIJ